jgi:hypothetical protein
MLIITCPDLFAGCGQTGSWKPGRQDIDIHLLKPARFRPNSEWALPPNVSRSVLHDEVLDPEPAWMSYEFSTARPVLLWLPTKPVKWIGANLSDELRIP